MVIELFHDLFNVKDFRILNLLIQLCLDRERYSLYTDIFNINDNDSFKRLDYDDRQILTQRYNEAIQNQNIERKQKTIIDVDYLVKAIPNHDATEIIEFNLDEARVFFNQPVSILLENSLNDAYLMHTIIYHFDDVQKIKRHLENRWIQFENLGSCSNMENFINSKLFSFNSFPKAPFQYLRCFVLLDSDRISNQKRKEHKHLDRIRFLRKNKIANHVLEKRNMENYMPIEVFNEFKDGKLDDWVDAFGYLSEKQKDFFSINVGFSKKNESGESIFKRLELEKEIQDLYSDVSDSNYEILDKGFKPQNFKTAFPRKFIESHNVNRKTLLNRIREQENQTEFEEILQKINDLL